MDTTSNSYDISVKDGALVLTKKNSAKVDYDDGIILDIPGKTKPRHLQFYCKSNWVGEGEKGEGEACNLRLTKRNVKQKMLWSEQLSTDEPATEAT